MPFLGQSVGGGSMSIEEMKDEIVYLRNQAEDSEDNGFSSDAEAFWLLACQLEKELKGVVV